MASSGKKNRKPIITIMVLLAVAILILLLLRQCYPKVDPGWPPEPGTKGPDTEKEEEVKLNTDTFYFWRNLSNTFDNRTSDSDLDKLADELKAVNLGEKDKLKIVVQGFAAYAENSLVPEDVSENRGIFIRDKLKDRLDKRGITAQFNDPPRNPAAKNRPIEEEQRPHRYVKVTATRITVIPGPEIPGKEGKDPVVIDCRPFIDKLMLILGIAFAILGLLLLLLGGNKEKKDLPPEAIQMLREMGLKEAEIETMKEKYGGSGTKSLPEKIDEAWKKYCDEQTEFLREVYKQNLADEGVEGGQGDRNTVGKRAQAKLYDRNPNRLRVAENFQELKEGKKTVESQYIGYRSLGYIKTMRDFAFYTVDVRRTLGVKIFPSNRREKDQYGRPGCFRLADLATAIDNQELSEEDAGKAVDLAQRIYNISPKDAPNTNDVAEFEEVLKQAPWYSVDAMVWHENVDGHTLDLLASGKLHSGTDSIDETTDEPGGLPHNGGNLLIREAEKIIRSR